MTLVCNSKIRVSGEDSVPINPTLNVACGAGQESLRGGGTLAGVSRPVGADSFRRTGGGLLTFLLKSNCSYILVV